MATYTRQINTALRLIQQKGRAVNIARESYGTYDPATQQTTSNGTTNLSLYGVTLPAGGHLQWTETWYPVAGLGGLRYANELVALNLSAGSGQAEIALAVTRLWSGDMVLLLDGQEYTRQAISLAPGTTHQQTIDFNETAPSSGRLTLRLEIDGTIVAEYSAEFNSK